MAQGSCDLFNDPCRTSSFDLQCDDPTGLNLCPANSDCFDCDIFQSLRSLGCDACVTNGGRYCETADGSPVCSDPAIAAQAPNACLEGGGTPYVSTCSGFEPPPSTGGDCDLLNDPCPFTLDLECDDPSGLNFCPSNSDCFDCDPFQQFRFAGCDACVANGGRYCEIADGTPVCSSPEIADLLPECLRFRGGGTPYMSSCDGGSPPPVPSPTGSPPIPSPTSTSASPPTPGSNSGGGSSGGLAALSVLALIPIAGIGFFIYWRRKRSAGEGSQHGKRDDNAQEVTASNNSDNPVNPSEDRQPWLSSPNHAARVPQPPAHQSDRGGGYLPTNKDQAQSVIYPQAQSVSHTSTLSSGSGFQSRAVTRVSQDPPADPPTTASSATASSAHAGRREVIAERQSSGPPLAEAIVIEPSAVESTGKSDI